MSEVTVASTTDTQESVNRAAGLEEGDRSQVTGDREDQHQGPEEGDRLQVTGDRDQEERDSEPEAAAAESSDAKPKKAGVQKRIDTLTRRMYEQQEELDGLRERVNQEVQTPVKGDSRPIASKFRSYDEYIEALADWKAGQRLQQQKQVELAQAEQERTREVFDHYNEAARAARVKYEDFEEVVGRRDLKIPQAVQVAIIEAGDVGPDIAYYLGKNPELCQELAEMSPMRAIARIGQIEGQVTGKQQIPRAARNDKTAGDAVQSSATSPARTRTMTSAPAPITPVGGGSSKTTVPLGELPYRDYKRLRDREELANR
jgi:hypothetical protein